MRRTSEGMCRCALCGQRDRPLEDKDRLRASSPLQCRMFCKVSALCPWRISCCGIGGMVENRGDIGKRQNEHGVMSYAGVFEPESLQGVQQRIHKRKPADVKAG